MIERGDFVLHNGVTSRVEKATIEEDGRIKARLRYPNGWPAWVTLPTDRWRIIQKAGFYPDPTKHKSEEEMPAYLRELVAQSGLTQEQVADVLDINPRLFRKYLAGTVPTRYVIQFAVECTCVPSGNSEPIGSGVVNRESLTS